MRKLLSVLLLMSAFALPVSLQAANNDILHEVGTPQICFADHAGDFLPSADADDLQQGTPDTVELELAGVTDAAAEESAKCDLGSDRAMAYSVMASIQIQATPTTGDVIEFYWGASPDPEVDDANPGYLTGVDQAYTGTPGTLAEGVAQLIFIGSLVCTADAGIQKQHIGVFSPSERYGILVVKNECGATLDADDIESHVVFNPIVTEVQ